MSRVLKNLTFLVLLAFATGVLSACGNSVTGGGAPLIDGSMQGIHGRILYYSDGAVYVINADGSNLTHLTFGGAWPSWSPDGTRIAHVSGPDGGSFEDSNIYVMNADGSQKTRISTGGGTAPFWSPDGRSIAYTPAHLNNDDIYVMNVDGSNARQVATEGGYEVVWSPDGTRIAYGCGKQICTVNVDSARSQQLTTQGGRTPAWSPDGSKIAFGSDGDIYDMQADGSAITLLTDSKGVYSFPSWSPDGTRIAFIGKPSSWLDQDDPLGYGVYVMHANGSQVARLTNPQLVEPTGRPVWSPDGSVIAFTAWPGGKRGGITDIYIVKADGSALTRLASNGDSPVWQPRSVSTP